MCEKMPRKRLNFQARAFVTYFKAENENNGPLFPFSAMNMVYGAEIIGREPRTRQQTSVKPNTKCRTKMKEN